MLAPAVVFGRVTEGMAVVKRMEAMGTSSGKPRTRIVIADCGQVGRPARQHHALAKETSQQS